MSNSTTDHRLDHTRRRAISAGRERPDRALLANIHARIDDLETLRARCDDRWGSEDLIYRFWHQSFKALALQDLTEQIVVELEALRPEGTDLDPWFKDIIAAGTGLTFDISMNQDWPGQVGPVVIAFFHARFMLEMAVRYGHDLETTPGVLPSGWAALLELYGIR